MNLSNFVAYVKQAWKNKPDTSTPLSAERLTHLEEGIKGNSDAIQELAAAVVSQIVNDPNKIASMAALYAANQKIGDTSKLPAGTTDVASAIAQLYSNISTFGYSINPNIVKTFFSIVNGWDTGVQNVPSFAKNHMCILITVWVYPDTTGNLEAEHDQVIFSSGHFAIRGYQNQTWSEWQ